MRILGRSSVVSFIGIVVNMAWGLMALGLILIVLLLASSPFIKGLAEVDASWMVVGTRMTIPVSFTVDTRTHAVAAPLLGIENAEILDAHGSLRFPTQKGLFFFGNGMLLAALFGLTLWMLGQLRSVLRTLRDGRPFVPDNAVRIRRIGLWIIAAELIRSVTMFFENYYAATYFSAAGLRFETRFDLSLFAIVEGLIVVVIAEVFRAGTRLDEDRSLTI